MYDLIIVGGGAASQSAAMYAIEKQINFLMIYQSLGGRVGERLTVRREEDVPVGHILVHTESVDAVEKEDHLPGSEAVHLFETHIMEQTGHILKDEVLAVSKADEVFHVETKQHGTQQGRTLILATGDRRQTLDIPGTQHVIRGLGYQTAAHAEKLSGKIAAVVGLTERALRGTAELAQTAQKVYLVTPEAIQPKITLVEALRKHPRVEMLEGYKLTEVLGSTQAEKIVIAGKEGTQTLDVDVVFTARGLIPNSDIVKDLVDTDEDGFIHVDGRNATNMPGLFAAGDVTTAFGREVLIAIGEGARAALSAHDYLLAHMIGTK